MDRQTNNQSGPSTNRDINQELSQTFTDLDISTRLDSPTEAETLTGQPSHRHSATAAPFASVHAFPGPNFVEEYMQVLTGIVNSSIQPIEGVSAAEIGRVGPSDGSMMIRRRIEEALDALSGVESGDMQSSSPTELVDLEENIGYANMGLTHNSVYENLEPLRCCSCCMPREDEACCICQDKYKVGHAVGALDCGHEFHYSCILEWLVVNNSCPVCRVRGLDI